MKKFGVLHVVFPVLCAAIFVNCPEADAGNNQSKSKSLEKRAVPVSRVVSALRKGCPQLEVVDKKRTKEWTWVEIQYLDQTYPLTIDVMARKGIKPEKTIYLIPLSSLNFMGSYFTPAENSLARYFADHGYLVVGISPRENNVPLTAEESVVADWGVEQHRLDIRMIVELVQLAINKRYDMLGHSLGTISVLDYAATYSDKMDTAMILGMPSFDPVEQPEKIYDAELAHNAYEQLMNSGVYADYLTTQFKDLLLTAAVFPDADSGVDRSMVGLSGNFTYSGLMHFSMIYAAFLPGTITPLTGLPQEWPLIQGFAAGYYNFSLDPLEDDFGFNVMNLNDTILLAERIGSGIGPLAFLRDYTSAIADIEGYQINWSGIDEKVIWVNGELGMGAQMYGADLIRAAGNDNVSVSVVPGYGHIDVILGFNAANDVWQYFLQ